VDSLRLWDHVLDIPFYAIPPDRIADQVIPVFSRSESDGEVLSVNKRADQSEHAAFQALPAAVAEKLPQDRAVSSAVVPLYEYRDAKTGRRFYSVAPVADTAGLTPSEQPICRAWKNPSSLVLLDWKATPVPYVRAQE
jgi:hypothetical protein